MRDNEMRTNQKQFTLKIAFCCSQVITTVYSMKLNLKFEGERLLIWWKNIQNALIPKNLNIKIFGIFREYVVFWNNTKQFAERLTLINISTRKRCIYLLFAKELATVYHPKYFMRRIGNSLLSNRRIWNPPNPVWRDRYNGKLCNPISRTY